MDDPIRVAIVGNDEEFRQELHMWLASASDILIVGEAKSERLTLQWLQSIHPDVVLLDMAISAPYVGQISALAHVLILHLPGQEAMAREALLAGALGHLERQNVHPQEVIDAVRTVNRGEVVLSPIMAGWIVDEVARRRLKDERERKDEQ